MNQLHEIRLSVKENQGQGFLVNATGNIQCFINFQNTLPKAAVLPPSPVIAPIPTIVTHAAMTTLKLVAASTPSLVDTKN